MSDVSLGSAAAALEGPEELLNLEREAAVASFSVDTHLSGLVTRALRGSRVVEVTSSRDGDKVSLRDLEAEAKNWVADSFWATNQQKRGAWYIPKEASLEAGLVNLAWHYEVHPRFAVGAALDERARVSLSTSPEGLLVWAVLEPLFQDVYMPLMLRAEQKTTKTREDLLDDWTSAYQIASDLGYEINDLLNRMRFGSGWSRLKADQQLAIKTELMEALGSQAGSTVLLRYRCSRILRLIKAYYIKAKDGRALRRRVLTRDLHRTLTGFFGGDWLAFLDYIGEQPHPDEEIITALPEARLFVGGSARAEQIAAERGLPVREVEQMLTSYWGRSSIESPVEQRTKVLKEYWAAFDGVHAAQQAGMSSLWGFVEEGGFLNFDDIWRSPYEPGSYRRLLPQELSNTIESLWGAVMISRWPDRVVSEPWPHSLMADTFGAALKFWHGCALTAWFICEGPYSRTDLGGLAEYHQRELAELSDMKAMVDERLFSDLLASEKRLGPPEPITTESSTTKSHGFETTMSMSIGTRRNGFEILRDVITKHRRQWAADNLDTYLTARWETEIREAAEAHARLLNEKGKTPTAKQFAKHGQVSANHWFGGDLSLLYAAIGEKSAIKPERVSKMPSDRIGFAWSVFVALGGTPFERNTVVSNRDEGEAQAQEQQRHHNLKRLAQESLRFVQLEEALGRAPELKEFGLSKFEWAGAALHSDISAAWDQYVEAIDKAKTSPVPPGKAFRSPPVTVAPRPLPSGPDHESDLMRAGKDKPGLIGKLFRRGSR
jgi:hypothetical protein